MLLTSPTYQYHTQITPTIPHETKISGYAQLHGEFNYDATPLSPLGTQVIINEGTTVRGTWESHGLKRWYPGP